MPDLTLDQVREAERFAWHPSGQIFVSGADGIRDLMLSAVVDVEESGGTFVGFRVTIESLQPAPLPRSVCGWHHVPDCDCEFCRG